MQPETSTAHRKSVRHLLKISSFTREEVKRILQCAANVKENRSLYRKALKRKSIWLLFAKPSLRTRVSFEVAIHQLGGTAIFYPMESSPLGKKENVHDSVQCLSRYVDIIAVRVASRQTIEEFAEHSDVPVINMLDDWAHPCQIMADLQTIIERKGDKLESLKLAYFGDAHNNVTYDLMRAAAMFGMTMSVACPAGAEYTPDAEVLTEVAELSLQTGANVQVTQDPYIAAKDADVVYTDSWMSYSIPRELEEERKSLFMPYQVNANLMQHAKPNAMFMNCLPAQRNMEQTADVIDGPQSVVFDQAENRLHAQKAIMLFLLGMPLKNKL